MFCDVAIPKTKLDGLTYAVDPERLPGLAPGDCVRVLLRGRKAAGIVVRLRERSPVKKCLPVEELVEAGLVPADLLELVQWTAAYYCGRLGEVLNFALPAAICPRARRRKAPEPARAVPDAAVAARDAAAGFAVSVCADDTRIAGRVAESVAHGLERGSVIVLAPAPDAVRPMLPKGVVPVELVSGLKRTLSRAAWREARAGGRVVSGTRSAVFAPVPDLAGIVVLDEHDPVYKEERRPHFSARDAAIARARLAGCPVLLCDPTPSAETWHQLEAGRFQWLDRPADAAAKAVVVDMKHHRGELFAPRLLRALDKTREAGRASVLYVNRLGVSRGVACRECGAVLSCPDCRTPVVLHQGGALTCRFCGRKDKAPESCPECGASDFQYRLPGVDMIVREVSRLRPEWTVATVTGAESDVPSADVLVGTKALLGREWPGPVGLVAAVRADDDLALPDFRSGERVFATLWRLGRRAALGGAEFIIQTRRPGEPALAAAAEMDPVGFYNGELKRRAETGFPPFRRLALVELSDRDEAHAERSARALARRLSRLSGVEILGPIPTGPNRPERQLLVKLGRQQRFDRLVALGELERFGREVRVDVDPQTVV